MTDHAGSFVPGDFVPPESLDAAGFYLEPLGPQHNASDYQAWTSSIDHIKQTPGFIGRRWPDPGMTIEQNLSDLERHADDFAQRKGFTYTVLDPHTRDVIGCVYIYPARQEGHDAEVTSWVSTDHASRDHDLRVAVGDWLTAAWPFRAAYYER